MTLQQIKDDPRVTDVWKEEDGCFDGHKYSYWVSLAPGFNWDGCSTIHEPTVKKLGQALKNVEAGDPY